MIGSIYRPFALTVSTTGTCLRFVHGVQTLRLGSVVSCHDPPIPIRKPVSSKFQTSDGQVLRSESPGPSDARATADPSFQHLARTGSGFATAPSSLICGHAVSARRLMARIAVFRRRLYDPGVFCGAVRDLRDLRGILGRLTRWSASECVLRYGWRSKFERNDVVQHAKTWPFARQAFYVIAVG